MKENKKPVVAIMRPENYLEKSAELARSMGFEPVIVPMVELTDMKDEYFGGFAERIMSGKSDYVIFTSANGIDYTLSKTEDREAFIAALNSTKIIAIGPTTRKSLEDAGINTDGMPEVYSSEGLVDYLCPEIKGKIIDTARSYYGSSLLIDGLKRCGADVHETKVYTLVRPQGREQQEFIDRVLEGEIDVFIFTSSMMVRNFFAYAQDQSVRNRLVSVMNNSVVAAIGMPTAETIESYGVEVSLVPEESTFESMLKNIRKLVN